jgi:hypothetical protein
MDDLLVGTKVRINEPHRPSRVCLGAIGVIVDMEARRTKLGAELYVRARFGFFITPWIEAWKLARGKADLAPLRLLVMRRQSEGKTSWSLPRPTNPRQSAVPARFRMALRAQRQQFLGPKLQAWMVRRLANANHIGPADGGDHQHKSERKKGRQNAASSPSHVALSILKRMISEDRRERAFYQQRRVAART